MVHHKTYMGLFFTIHSPKRAYHDDAKLSHTQYYLVAHYGGRQCLCYWLFIKLLNARPMPFVHFSAYWALDHGYIRLACCHHQPTPETGAFNTLGW
ncbi:hypothetical protein AO376_0954 [Moraxella catarrhalis]|nr:hypothetical protein AO376_0954 [Moraxella catarrhalis]OAV18306.1 hypothetical protein AO374_1038 [Moraxella catarrhalis]